MRGRDLVKSRNFRVLAAIPIVLGAVAMLGGGCSEPKSKAGGKRLVVLGFDGMDPRALQRMIDQGRMPNFKKLIEKGGLWNLGTSIPPQSPVAWSNFITGCDPGEHGIFDFIHRDPGQQTDPTSPFFSANKTEHGDEPCILAEHAIPLPWQNPPEIKLTRGGIPFWEYLEDAKVPSRFYRLPANYPPTPSKDGYMKSLSDMGTPDITGSQGTFQWFSADFSTSTEQPSGGMALPMTPVKGRSGVYMLELQGTGNPIEVKTRVDAQGVRHIEHPTMTLRMLLEIDRDAPIARLSWSNFAVGGLGYPAEKKKDANGKPAAEDEPLPEFSEELILEQGEWSGWQKVVFRTCNLDPGGGFPAIVRFWLKSANPLFPELYASPVNFDPETPMAEVSAPGDFVTEIGSEIGPFYTQGFAEDFKAFDAEVTDIAGDTKRLFDAEAYRIQSQIVMNERIEILDYALKHYEDGLLFVYFSSTDLVAHMMWWNPELGGLPPDAQHPTRTSEDAKKYHRVVEGIYEQCDEQLGKVMKTVGEDAPILVMSDHGFGPFQRKVNLNRWLYDNGYIVLKPGQQPRGALSIIADWSRTKAYSIGLNGIYLNMVGREREGSVKPEERDALLKEISEKLIASRDPENDRPVVRRMYRTDEVYHGPYAPGGKLSQHTPDLIVGYEYGYITRQGTMGTLTSRWLTDNRNEWSADHCIAAELVPGTLATNVKIHLDDPDLMDLAPTILKYFGVEKPAQMRGRNLLTTPPVRTASRE